MRLYDHVIRTLSEVPASDSCLYYEAEKGYNSVERIVNSANTRMLWKRSIRTPKVYYITCIYQ